MATLRHTLANLISVPLTMANMSMKKIIYPRNLYFIGIQRFSPGVVVDVDKKSKLKFGKHVSMHSRCRIVSTCGGDLEIGDNTSLNVGCIVVSRYKVSIGKNIQFGPNVMIYDHDHIMSLQNGTKGSAFNLGEVEIGDNTWIGAGTVILLGTHIGKNCVIGAGSVVKGNVPDNTVLIQKRVNTCKGFE